MNILILTDYFFPRIGGGEFAAHFLAKYLSERGHQVYIPLTEKIYPHIQHMKFNYHLYFYKSYPYIYEWMKYRSMVRLHRKVGIDLIHSNFLYPAGWMGIRFQKQFGVPCLATAQGADIRVYEPLNYGNLLDPLIYKRTKKIIEQAAGLIYTCEDIKNIMQELGATPERMFYAVNGSPYEAIVSNQRSIIRQQIGVSDTDVLFILVSRYSQIKGMHLMLDAVDEVRKYYEHFKVVLIGLDTKKMQAPIEKRGLGRYFHIVGEVPVETDPDTHIPRMPSQIIIDHLCAADVFISPALSGGFELSAMDAMSAGLAVILSESIGNKDLVNDGVNGYISQNNNPKSIAEKMKLMLTDAPRCRSMGEYNKKMAENYSWAKVVEMYEHAYSQVLSRWKKD